MPDADLRLRAWWGRFDRALLVLAVAAVAWTATFSVLVWRRHERFATADFDLGIHDQSVWLLSRGLSFCTVRGLDVFGHHATFAYYLLVPFYWGGGGPHLLNVAQTMAAAAGVVPLYLLARDRLGPGGAPWAAALAATWLAQVPLQFFVWETFHPEVMAVPSLMGAYVAGERARYGWCAGLVLLTLCWKEDLALAVAGLGLVWLLRGRRRLGAAVLAAGTAWFVVFAMWFVPAMAGGGTVYGPLYGDLGDTPGEVARTGLRHPDRVLERLADNDALGYLVELAAPFGLAALAAPALLLVGLPQAMVNLLSTAPFTFDLRYHYGAVPLAAVALASVEGVGRLVRRWPRWRPVVVGVVVAASLGSSLAWGPSPVGRAHDDGYWPSERPAEAGYRATLGLVGPHDGVSADYRVLPHLTHREVAYSFPNPWLTRNYGIGGTAGRPELVDWILVDRALLGPTEAALLDDLLASPEFEVVLERAGVVAARRTGP